MDIDGQINGSSFAPNKEWWQKASTLARLGSGSASRSVYAGAALWGRMADVNASNDLFAIPWETEISSIYKTYQDTILIISASEKSVSSTAGHKLMDGLPYADMRYAEARRHMLTLMEAMRHDHSLDLFISVVESEALQLHALMMSGDSPFLLMEAGTISVIKEVWRYRKETGIPVCFTLDAGPNVHLLYPLEYKDTVLDWIIRHLVQFCKDGMYIADHTGSGPEKIS
jgi:diphosphomevalonate decarboxylase